MNFCIQCQQTKGEISYQRFLVEDLDQLANCFRRHEADFEPQIPKKSFFINSQTLPNYHNFNIVHDNRLKQNVSNYLPNRRKQKKREKTENRMKLSTNRNLQKKTDVFGDLHILLHFQNRQNVDTSVDRQEGTFF